MKEFMTKFVNILELDELEVLSRKWKSKRMAEIQNLHLYVVLNNNERELIHGDMTLKAVVAVRLRTGCSLDVARQAVYEYTSKPSDIHIHHKMLPSDSKVNQPS